MPVTCSHCGEELLGAVNCCWKCGAKFALRPEMDGRPPFRRPPVLDPEPAAATTAEVTIAEVTDADVSSADVPDDAVAPNIRRGSPFVTSATLAPAPRTTNPPLHAPVVAPAPTNHSTTSSYRYSDHMVSIVAAVSSVVLGLASLMLSSYFPIGALAIAVVGLAMGVWGLYSTRRGIAVLGVILCCVALSLSGFRSVVLLYKSVYGYSPWESEDELNPSPDGMNEEQ